MARVAIQGQRASFHDQAAHLFFPNQTPTIIPKDSFDEVFAAVRNGQADYGVCATFNTIHDKIQESLQLLHTEPVEIIDEKELLIPQCLVGLPLAEVATITDVYAHFVALSQVKLYLAHQLPHAKIHLHADTAGAVADVAGWQDAHKAAIASQYAADYYNMKVLAKNIHGNDENRTRFVLFRRAATHSV
jgi:prephenate dehydratase